MALPSYDENQIRCVRTFCIRCKQWLYMRTPDPICVWCRVPEEPLGRGLIRDVHGVVHIKVDD